MTKITQIPSYARVPSCPRKLTTAAKKEWRRVSSKLLHMGRLTRSVFNSHFLAIYCQEFSHWKWIRDDLDRRKKTRIKMREYESRRLMEKIAGQYYCIAKEVCREFGFPMTERGMDLTRPLPLTRRRKKNGS